MATFSISPKSKSQKVLEVSVSSQNKQADENMDVDSTNQFNEQKSVCTFGSS